jgi:hypothetical protein
MLPKQNLWSRFGKNGRNENWTSLSSSRNKNSSNKTNNILNSIKNSSLGIVTKWSIHNSYSILWSKSRLNHIMKLILINSTQLNLLISRFKNSIQSCKTWKKQQNKLWVWSFSKKHVFFPYFPKINVRQKKFSVLPKMITLK